MLDQLITRIALEEFAGRTAFRRGENYFSAGSVSRLAANSAKVSAKVQGSQAYQVELRRRSRLAGGLVIRQKYRSSHPARRTP
jgi:uncharacterized Zn finger protein